MNDLKLGVCFTIDKLYLDIISQYGLGLLWTSDSQRYSDYSYSQSCELTTAYRIIIFFIKGQYLPPQIDFRGHFYLYKGIFFSKPLDVCINCQILTFKLN